MPKSPFANPSLPRPPALPRVRRQRGVFPRQRPLGVSLAAAEEIERRPFPDPPPFWTGTLPEWAVYWAHAPAQRGQEGVLWGYQTPVGGGYNLAGMVPDFLEFDVRIAININGSYWHYRKGSQPIKNDRLQRLVMQRFDYTLIVIDEEDALADPIHFLKDAIAGIDHSLSARRYGS